MSFDNTSSYPPADPAEGQQGEGGTNHSMNCVPTALTEMLMALHFPEIEPQHITDVEYGTAYMGGETFAAMDDYIHRYVDASLATSVEQGDVIATMELYGPRRFPMTFLGHCDANGNYTTTKTGWEHASVVLRRTDNWTVLRNSEKEQEVGYNDADLRQIYDGCLYVLRRSTVVNPSPVGSNMTSEQADSIAAAIDELALYIAGLERWPESDAALESNASQLANAFMAGSRSAVEAIIDNIAELKTALAARQAAHAASGVTMAQVQAEIAKAFNAGAAGA